jgi:hypothetical protein
MDVLQRQASAEPDQTSQLQLLEGLLTPSPRVMGRSHSAAAPSETAAVAAAGGPATSSGAVDAWAVVETKKTKQQQAKARRLQAVHLWAARIQVAAAAARIQAVVRGRRTRR